MLLVEESPIPCDTTTLNPDFLEIEWFEANKSIIRRKTLQGRDIAIRRKSRKPLQDGEILWHDATSYIQVAIRPCPCLVIRPRDWNEMGRVCFEIGNMHLPIQIDNNGWVSVAYDSPLHTYLQRSQYEVDVQDKKLLDTQLLTLHQLKR